MFERLFSYFWDGIGRSKGGVGMEIETSFLSASTGEPSLREETQGVFQTLIKKGWKILEQKGSLIATISDTSGNKLMYELGRQNLEVSTIPSTDSGIVSVAQDVLNQLYEAANKNRLVPYFEPILNTEENLLVVPDERDANWLKLDGREALAPLATISAVQFTVEVEKEKAIRILNSLGSNIDTFLTNYPQDKIWREYIRSSQANYNSLRYGGPLQFSGANPQNYCERLVEHDVIQGTQLIPHSKMSTIEIPLFLRSVWWYFRLRRYDDSLCIEIRPLARKTDELFSTQLAMVLNIMNL